MLDTIRMAAESIRSNPLGRLMYGQRELFHSNLLAWFFDELPNESDAVFQPLAALGGEKARSVAREQDNLDLVMLWPGRAPLVIENKVFSVPSHEQLERYELKTASWQNQPSLVLLSPSAPGFLHDRWTHIDYADLATRIEAALPISERYEVQTMRRYAALARDLNALMDGVTVQSDDEPVWLPEPVLDVLGSSQLRAALHKARAQRVAARISAALPDRAGAVNSAMTRSKPLVEVLISTVVDGVRLRTGWQLQEGQFRRSVLFEEPDFVGRSEDTLRAREQFAREHPELFTFPAALPQSRGGRSEYNHFKPDSIYQYVKAPSMTVGQLAAVSQEISVATAPIAEIGAPQG